MAKRRKPRKSTKVRASTKRRAKRSTSKGHIPAKILQKRYRRLGAILKARKIPA